MNRSERLRAEEALPNSESQSAFLLQLSDALRPLSDPLEIYAVVTRSAMNHFGADRCYYCEIVDGVVVIRRDAARGDLPSVVGEYPLRSFPLFEALMATGAPRIVHDANAMDGMDEALKQLCIQTQSLSFINVPVQKEGRYVGSFCITQRAPRNWTTAHVELAKNIAERTWDAVERARAEESLRARNRHLDLLARTGQFLIADGCSKRETLQTVFVQVADALETELFFGYLTEDGTPESLRLATSGGLTDAQKDALATARPGQSVCLLVAQRRESIIVENVQGTESPEAVAMHAGGVRAYAGFPLLASGRLIGTIAFATRNRTHFRAGEVQLIQTVCDQLATTLARAHAEEAVRASEERLRALIENLPGGAVFVVDKNLRYLVAEGEALTTAGFAAHDLVGRTIGEVMPPELAASHERRYRMALAGEAFEDEHTAHNRAYISRGVPLYTTSGDVYAVLAISYDITARKQMEEAVRASEERLQTLSDAVPQLIWTNSAEGTANYFNRRWYDYSGLTYEQSAGRGRGWQAMVHPGDAPASVEKWQRALASGDVFDTEYRLRGADGTYRWFLGRNIPLKNKAGAVTGWFGTATDIEEGKQAQAARQDSEERFRILVEGAQDYAMFLIEPNGRITFWSKGAERVFGWSEAEAVGQTSGLIFTPEDVERGAPEHEIQIALHEGRAPDRRWHVRKDNRRLWADGLLMRLDDEAGNVRGFAKVARDATEQKRDQEALQTALEAVAQANETLEARVQERTLALFERSRELTRMGELRQELLRQVVTAQEEERARIARDLHDDTGQQVTGLLLGLAALKSKAAIANDASAQSAIADLQGLANDIAQKSHRIALNLRPTALDDIGLMQALKNYAEQWSTWSGGVPLSVDSFGMETEEGKDKRLAPEIEITIYRIVQEALTNVLRHALSDRDDDARKPARHVSVLVQRSAREVLIIIEDDGPGFDVETALGVSPDKQRLGIFGMQERARLAGGTLEIESSLGEGTTLYLRIPLPPA